MSDEASSSAAFERYIAIGAGIPMLLIALSLFGWGVRLVVAGLSTEAGWPPGLSQLLLPVIATSLLVGIGAWRLLLTGVPERIGGYSLARMILAGFAAAALLGAVV